MRTSNPTLNDNTFSQVRNLGGEAMTIQGAVNKTFILLFLLVMAASWVWSKIIQPQAEGVAPVMNPTVPSVVGGAVMLGLIGGFIIALVTVFKKEWSPVTAPIYAILEGLLLGGVSAFFELQYPGIVMQAVALTFGTLFCLLGAYKSGLVQVTNNFRLGVVAATGAIFLVYLVNLIMGFFHTGIPLLSSSGPWGIGFSLVIVIIAALNLVLDFDFIERGASAGAPKYMEWYSAFGLMVTLVWLYLEILRLLVKFRGRR